MGMDKRYIRISAGGSQCRQSIGRRSSAPSKRRAVIQIDTTVLIGVVTALAATIGVLYRQNLKQQEQVEGLLCETKELMGGLAELVRAANGLMVEVKDGMTKCAIYRRQDQGNPNEGGN